MKIATMITIAAIARPRGLLAVLVVAGLIFIAYIVREMVRDARHQREMRRRREKDEQHQAGL